MSAEAERNVVPRVVQELNAGIAVDRGLPLEVIRWETDSYPGFHPEGPQGLIDRILRSIAVHQSLMWVSK
jgi:hypothetical protein